MNQRSLTHTYTYLSTSIKENMRFHTKHMQRNPQKRWSRSDKITNEPPWSQKKKIMCWSYETWWWWHMLINYNEHTKGLVFSKYQLFCVFNLIRLYEIPIDSLISIFLDPTYHHIFSPEFDMICLQAQNKKMSKHSETLNDTNCSNVCLTQEKRFKNVYHMVTLIIILIKLYCMNNNH